MFYESLNEKKRTLLFVGLSFFFLTNALVAEFMGVKIFSLEKLINIETISFRIFGEKIEGISFTCGVILWPFVFIMTDIINEYFGRKGVKFLSYMAAIMIGYSFIMLNAAMHTPPAPWWIFSSNYGEHLNFHEAYNSVFGQGLNIIIGSLTAFIVGQLVDVYIYHEIKKR
ncbi:MAG: queuosine precursor transporter, partial [Bacteroidetes bacterium]|nr:queuosine precursor transporter [Bacteroidota bacterium]